MSVSLAERALDIANQDARELLEDPDISALLPRISTASMHTLRREWTPFSVRGDLHDKWLELTPERDYLTRVFMANSDLLEILHELGEDAQHEISQDPSFLKTLLEDALNGS